MEMFTRLVLKKTKPNTAKRESTNKYKDIVTTKKKH